MKTWLIIDCHYLLHRAFHTLKDLSFGGVRTGVVYGFLRDLENLRSDFGTDRVVLAFDSSSSLRRDLFPDYKRKRHDKPLSDEDLILRNEFINQIKILRKSYLPRIGYTNVFWQKGYESDDIIASVVHHSLGDDEATIISADGDLWQLINPRVMVHNPTTKGTQTHVSFTKKYGIEPEQWAMVKAVGGCHTDEVPGVPSIGEGSALHFVAGRLDRISAARLAAIQSPDGGRVIQRNLKLVKLPFEGVARFDLRPNRWSIEGWREVSAELGIRSLRGVPSAKKRASFAL